MKSYVPLYYMVYSISPSDGHFNAACEAKATWVNRGGQLEAKVQLATDMICWQPATQRVTHHPIPAEKEKNTGSEKIGSRERQNEKWGL